MITIKNYVPYRQRTVSRKISEAVTSVIMFLITWILLALWLGLSPN